MSFKLLLIGLLSGFLSAFFGIGGGIVSVSALTIFLRVPLKQAIGTSLVCVTPVALVGVLTEWFVRPENLLLEIGIALSVGAIAGTFVGKLAFAKASESTLRWIYAFFLLVVAMRLVGIFQFISTPPFNLERDAMEVWAVCAGIGVVAGASSTLFGIGGGIFAVPLMLLFVQGVFFHSARATSLLMIFPAALIGLIHHRSLGTVDWKIGKSLVFPAVVGSVAGVFVVQEVRGTMLQSLFAALLVIAAWKLLRDGLKKKVGEPEGPPMNETKP